MPIRANAAVCAVSGPHSSGAHRDADETRETDRQIVNVKDAGGIASTAHQEPASYDWYEFGLADDVRPFIEDSVALNQAIVIGTLVRIEGGGPRDIGAQMAFAGDRLCGFFSGGCVESDVARHAKDVLAQGRMQRLVYGRGSPFFDIRLLCGARMEILLDKVDAADPALRRLLALTASRQAAIWMSDGHKHLCLPLIGDAPERWLETFQAAQQTNAYAGEVGDTYWVRYRPRIRVYVAGQDPTSLAIASLSSQIGFETIFIRKNGPVLPPPVRIQAYWRGEIADAFKEFGVDPWTAVVAANHDLEADHTILEAALVSPATYVGVLGSRRHKDRRLRMLQAAGLSPERLARLKAPIGIPLESKMPWQIALSVVCEISQEFHRLPCAAEGAQSGVPSGL